MMTDIYKRTRTVIGNYSILLLSKSIRISYVFGSQCAFFSLHQCVAPLMGTLRMSHFAGISLIHLMYLLWKCNSILALLHFSHIPTLCAAAYMATVQHDRILARRIMSIVPALCALLFICHPTGIQAAAYIIPWVIPCIASWLPHQSRFLHALSATFTAHAVGSICWLYSTTMSAESWIALIPIVWIERLTWAAGIALGYTLIQALRKQNVYPYVARVLNTYTS